MPAKLADGVGRRLVGFVAHEDRNDCGFSGQGASGEVGSELLPGPQIGVLIRIAGPGRFQFSDCPVECGLIELVGRRSGAIAAYLARTAAGKS